MNRRYGFFDLDSDLSIYIFGYIFYFLSCVTEYIYTLNIFRESVYLNVLYKIRKYLLISYFDAPRIWNTLSNLGIIFRRKYIIAFYIYLKCGIALFGSSIPWYN